MKKKIVVGVWKDKLVPSSSVKLAEFLSNRFKGETWEFLGGIAPTPLATMEVFKKYKDSPIEVIYQDIHWPAESGSYIGSTSIDMLKDIGIKYTMVGHSERRNFFGETDKGIREKLLGCIKEGISPILCIGDSETEIDARNKVLEEQIRNVMSPDLSPQIDLSKISVAYEPVWAISTWRTDTPIPTGREASEMLNNVRCIIKKVTNQDPSTCPILFGGSVNPNNAYEYFLEEAIDGALVGGASLKGDSMVSIFESAIKAWG